MKKLSPKQREHWIRVSQKRDERRLESEDRRDKKRGVRPKHARRRRHRVKRIPIGLRIVAPKMFVLEDSNSRRELIRMLSAIRQHVLLRGTGVRIDFTLTERMFPSGTLLFMAEIDRLQRLIGRRAVISGNYPRNLVVEQVLQQLGILGMLGLPSRRVATEFPENVKHWRRAVGEQVIGAEGARITEQYDGRLATSLKNGLYAGIVEAMTNCVQHAYLGIRQDGLPESMANRCKSWWMFSQEKDGQLTVALCDLGIGIPVSLRDPKKWSQELLERFMAAVNLSNPDASLIKAAVELHKTRTGAPHRGTGLRDILAVVRKVNSGFLLIASNHGAYRYDATTREERLRDYGESMMGTLVQWTIPLPENTR